MCLALALTTSLFLIEAMAVVVGVPGVAASQSNVRRDNASHQHVNK